MYQTLVTSCDELPSSRGREELAEAAGLTYQMDVVWRDVLCERQYMTQTCTAWISTCVTVISWYRMRNASWQVEMSGDLRVSDT